MQLKSRSNPEQSPQVSGLFSKKPRLLLGALFLLFIAALAIRISSLEAIGIIAERQYRSALIARAIFFQSTDSIAEWRKHIATTSQQRVGIVEPPITELMAAIIYRLVREEHLNTARLLCALFWVVGGIFLFRIAARIVSTDAAVFATAYYLFVPLGVAASISFLPEPLMIMMFLFSLLTILRYYEQPSKHRLVLAGVVSGLAILIKPFIVFTVLGAFISLAIHEKATLKRKLNFDFFIFLGICFSLGAAFYLYGIFIGDFLTDNFRASFLPYLFFERGYWKGWLLAAIAAVGLTPLIAALISLPMLRKGLSRALLIGLWIGYVVFGLVYTYPVPISGHYHLQLIIIVALSFGHLATLIINHLMKLQNNWYWWLPVIGALTVVMLFNKLDIRTRLTDSRNYEREEIAREVGKIVDHSDRVVYVATYYGMPLEYYGELSGTYWPRRIVDWDWVKDRLHGVVDQSEAYGDRRITYWISRRLDMRELSIEERLNALGFAPEYFVVTDFNEFNRHHIDLKEYLANSCSLVAESDQYLIYQTCTK